MKRVILESPYAGETDADVAANVEYARRCVADSLKRGEAPLASHLLYTQPGILDDRVAAERALGIAAGLAWLPAGMMMVVYEDRGISPGMEEAMKQADECGVPVQFRKIDRPA